MFFYSFYLVLQYCLFRLFPPGWGLFWHFWLTFRFPPWGIWSKNFKICQIPTPCPHSPPPPAHHGVYIDRCIKFNWIQTCSTFLRRDRFTENSDVNESVFNFRISLMLPRSLQWPFFCTLESGKIFDIFYRIAI